MSNVDAGRSALSDEGVDFEPDSGELTGPNGTTRLAPQPAALLALLVERTGEVVSRSTIRDHLWPGGRVEFDQGIAFAVREIRKALEDVGADPAVVETLPRRGLRIGEGAASTEGSRRAESRWVGGSWRTVALGVLVGVALSAGVWRMSLGPGGPAAAPVVVVFPYDRGDGWDDPLEPPALAEAVTARLTTDLEGEAGVIGPTGTAGLRGPEDTEGARTLLGACLVLSGSVRQVGVDSLLVFTQLVRTSDRVHVWAARDTLSADAAASEIAASAVPAVRNALPSC